MPTAKPNQAHSANTAMTVIFHSGHQWRGVADAQRSV
jgi:hypothetical protein